MLSVAAADDHRCVRHSAAHLLEEMGLDLSTLLGGAVGAASKAPNSEKGTPPRGTPPPTEAESAGEKPQEKDPFRNLDGEIHFERFRGAQQLLDPSTYNLQTIRSAAFPGCSCFTSARALASLLDYALCSERLVTPSALASARRFRGSFRDAPACWALGFELLGHAVRGSGASAERFEAWGHTALGGSICVCVPRLHLSVAICVSQLSLLGVPTKEILG